MIEKFILKIFLLIILIKVIEGLKLASGTRNREVGPDQYLSLGTQERNDGGHREISKELEYKLENYSTMKIVAKGSFK